MISVVAFDLDDTLIAEADYVRSGLRAVARSIALRFGREVEEVADELERISSEHSARVFDRYLLDSGLDCTQREIDELVGTYRCHVPDIAPFEDVAPTFEFLRRHGFGIAVITDGYLTAQEAKMRVVERYVAVDKVLITDSLGRDFWKPHPRAFREVADHFGIDPAGLMYVGDNPAKDFRVSAELPVTTVRIHRPGARYARIPYLDGVKEHFSIHSLMELPGLFLAIGSRVTFAGA